MLFFYLFSIDLLTQKAIIIAINNQRYTIITNGIEKPLKKAGKATTISEEFHDNVQYTQAH